MVFLVKKIKYPLFLFWSGNNAFTEEQPIVIIELQILLRITLRLLNKELDKSISQDPAQLPDKKTKITICKYLYMLQLLPPNVLPLLTHDNRYKDNWQSLSVCVQKMLKQVSKEWKACWATRYIQVPTHLSLQVYNYLIPISFVLYQINYKPNTWSLVHFLSIAGWTGKNRNHPMLRVMQNKNSYFWEVCITVTRSTQFTECCGKTQLLWHIKACYYWCNWTCIFQTFTSITTLSEIYPLLEKCR